MDYFTLKERESQEKFRAFRDRCFRPLLELLAHAGVNPNHVSSLGVICLLAACLLDHTHYLLAAVLLLLYLLMDAVDGPLARRLGKSHEGGSIVDMLADQIGVVAVPAGSVWHLNANGVAALVFSTGYLVLIVLAVLENELREYKPRTFVRVKYPVYALYVVALYQNGAMLLDWTFAVFALYYWWEVYARTGRIYDYYRRDRRGNE